MGTVTLSSDVVPPVGRQDRGLSRAPFPYLDEQPRLLIKAEKNSRSRLRCQLLVSDVSLWGARAPAIHSARGRSTARITMCAGWITLRAGDSRCDRSIHGGIGRFTT